MRFFALTTRGLERVCASEIADVAAVGEIGYRRVGFEAEPGLALTALRTVDDCFIAVGERDGVGRPRSALAELSAAARAFDLRPAAAACGEVRELPPTPSFAVTASFVGRRNYSTDEIKAAIAAPIESTHGWRASARDDQADLNLRVFIEHERAWFGVRLARRPLQDRPWKSENRPGSLKPPVAAALVRLAGAVAGEALLDPCCGSGTIAIEAAAIGCRALVGDRDPAALGATAANAAAAAAPLALARWDATRLPLAAASLARIAVNPPWDQQVAARGGARELWSQLLDEVRRVLAPEGRCAVLVPEDLHLPGLAGGARVDISLAGASPAIVVVPGR